MPKIPPDKALEEAIKHVLADALAGLADAHKEALARVCGAAASSCWHPAAAGAHEAWRELTNADRIGSRWIAFKEGWAG